MISAMHSYKQTQYNTVNRADIILMLYDGAIRFLDQAKEKIIEKDMQGKGNLISKVLDIVHELNASLNMDKGGEVAKNLHDWYSLCSRNLLKINLSLDIELLDTVRANLQRMRDTFAEGMQTPEAKLMLNRMGPLAQSVTSNYESPMFTGNDIADRAMQIKHMQERAKALESAKQNLSTSASPEETKKAQKELEKLLQRDQAPTFLKQDSSAMKQKAVQAFNRATPKTFVNPDPENNAITTTTETTMQQYTKTTTPQSQITPPVTEKTPVTEASTVNNQAPASNGTPKSPMFGNSALMQKKMTLYKSASNS